MKTSDQQRAFTNQHITTGASSGGIADPEHARLAVQSAIAKLKKIAPSTQTITSVLLFLSIGYAHKPQDAIKEAAKAAGTTQINGCCSIGLFTEEHNLLDNEGAVAMVFSSNRGLQSLALAQQNNLPINNLLTLSSPNAAPLALACQIAPQFGAIVSDYTGEGPFSIWQSGHIVEREFSHSVFIQSELTHTIRASAARPISKTMQINRAQQHSLIEVNQQTALHNLDYSLQALSQAKSPQPFELVAVVSNNTNKQAFNNGDYRLLHVIATDIEKQQVQLSDSVKSGCYLFWAIRDTQHARNSFDEQLINIRQSVIDPPKCALLFTNISANAQLQTNAGNDIDSLQSVFTGLPTIGFHSQGEIAPIKGASANLYQHNSVLGLFS